jgi:hypothetical protein
MVKKPDEKVYAVWMGSSWLGESGTRSHSFTHAKFFLAKADADTMLAYYISRSATASPTAEVREFDRSTLLSRGSGCNKNTTRTSKFKNIKTVVGEIEFDSKAESEFYRYLQTFGVEPELQPEFELLPRKDDEKKRYGIVSEINYIADFAIGDIVFDVKGMQTDVFMLKKNMFVRLYPEKTLVLVKKSGRSWKFYRYKVTMATETTILELGI